MIKSVRCDQSSFKTVEFKKGFNVVLAERKTGDSRNGVGKTALIEIIHFCLGGSTKPDKGLRVKELRGWTFILDLTLNGKDYSIYRNTSDFSRVKIEGDFSDWPIKPEYDRLNKEYIMKIRDWNTILGYLMFDLPIEVRKKKYAPSFRSLISYFARLGVPAFQDPFKHYPQQQGWDIQVNNTYLLGLNWEYATEFQLIKDKEKILKDLKSAAAHGLLTGFFDSLGDIESKRVELEAKIEALQEQLKTFKVHPQYSEIQAEANKLTEQIHELVNKNHLNQSILNKYRGSLAGKKDVSVNELARMYEEAGLVFSKSLIKRLDQIVIFHKKIVENREKYLQSEIQKISRDIQEMRTQIESITTKRADLLTILKTHGALEEYTTLINSLTTLKQQLEEIKNRISNLKKFEEGKSVLKIDKEKLLQKARRDFEERGKQVDEAMRYFNKNTSKLYPEPGVLSIDITNNGYKFKVKIKREESEGIGYMMVFCYDLMLAQLISTTKNMPGFLIHDSIIFDGVDERQIAKAIQLAAEESEKKGFQYICAINSDIVPYPDYREDFIPKFKQSIRVELTDEDSGGLFGFRF